MIRRVNTFSRGVSLMLPSSTPIASCYRLFRENQSIRDKASGPGISSAGFGGANARLARHTKYALMGIFGIALLDSVFGLTKFD